MIYFCELNIMRTHFRQVCSIESAARLNPNWDIFILFASPVGFSDDVGLTVASLIAYPNIYWRNVNLWAYGRDTPAEEWIFDEGQLFSSSYFTSHASEYLRYVR